MNKEFWIIRFGEHQDRVEALAEETTQLVRDLSPDDAERQAAILSSIESLLAKADDLYRNVWRTIGKPSNDHAALLKNVESRLSCILLDEFSKWPESGSGL